MRCGFVGLGTMGGPMALNVQKRLSSPPLIVWDRRQDARGVTAAKAAGCRAATSLADLAASCDVVVLCLPDSVTVESVLFDAPDALAHHLPPGALVIDCSTTHPDTARKAAARLRCGFVDAPVTGERAKAEQGTLTAMVGGSSACFRAARPVIDSFAREVVHVGGPGHGQTAKALNNCLYNVSVAAMAEVLPLAERLGLDVEALCRVVCSGTGQSFGFGKFAPLVRARAFDAPRHGYPMGAAFKDMQVVRDAAGSVGASLNVVDAARRTYEAALAAGLGSQHKGAMVKVWEDRLGVVVRATGRCEADDGGSGSDDDGGGGATRRLAALRSRL